MGSFLLEDEDVPGFFAPVHRALTEPILLGGAPRAVAIANGTLAGAVGLGLRLWIAGLVVWAIGHFAAVWAAKRDAQFVETVALGQIRHQAHLIGRGITGNAAFGLQRNIDDGVAINPVRRQIVAGPAGKAGMR